MPPLQITATVIGAFLATSAGYWFFWLKQRADAHAKFLGVTAGMRAQLDTMQHTNEQFFSDSRLLLGRAMYEVRRHLWPSKRRCMEETWRSYVAEDQKEFGTDRKALEAILATNRTAKQRLYDYLDQFDVCI